MIPASKTTAHAGKHLQPKGRYDADPVVLREGSQDAFELPSLENGKRIPRKAPALLASTVSAHSNLSRD